MEVVIFCLLLVSDSGVGCWFIVLDAFCKLVHYFLQTQDTHYYQDQTCPDQHQYQPQPQQSFGPTMDEKHYANSTEWEIEGLTVSQQNVQHCLKPDDELVLEMQRTYDEQQSNMDEMIRQVALLTEMIKGIQENRARSEMNESREEAEGVREAEGEETSNVEDKSEPPLGKREEVKTVEVESAEKGAPAEEESINTPPDDEALQKILDEANDEPQEKEDGVIKRSVEVDNVLFYLQSRKVHVPGEKVEKFTAAVEGENAPAERPPPVIDKSKGCCYEEESEPELQEERWRKKAARSIYWVQLQPWPEQLEVEKSPDHWTTAQGEEENLGDLQKSQEKADYRMVMYLQKKISGMEEEKFIQEPKLMVFPMTSCQSLN